jgi:hypothetical protein
MVVWVRLYWGDLKAAGFDMAIVEFLSDRFGLLYI